MQAPHATAPSQAGGRLAVAVLFLGSGAAALIYELVWYQLLRYVVGASSVSLALTLASFMAGLGLGAYFMPRWVGPHRHPLRVYAALEAGIALLGLGLRWGIPALGWAYAEAAGGGWGGGVVLRGGLCALCLVPPAMLMGATLPAVARWVSDTAEGVDWLSRYYALNTLGATAGVLMGGFWLMPTLTLTQVTLVAAGLNLAVAAWAWGMSRGDGWVPSPGAGHVDADPAADSPPRAPGVIRVGGVLWGVAGSGAAALGCQVVWTRLLSAVLSVTVYTFAIILAVFLCGLALGGAIGGAVARRTRRPVAMLGVAQVVTALGVVWAFVAIGSVVPGWGVMEGAGGWVRRTMARVGWFGNGDLWRFVRDVERVAWALLPATVGWGASVPLAIAVGWGRDERERGAWTGRVYAWNTAGAIAGALGVGLVALPVLGSAGTAKALLVLIGVNAWWVLWVARGEPKPTAAWPGLKVRSTLSEAWAALGWLARRGVTALQSPRRGMLSGGEAVLALVVVAALLLPGLPQSVLISGQARLARARQAVLVEGLHATSAVTTDAEGTREMWVSGKVVASSLTIDMRLQRMLGHLAVLAHGGEPRSVLIVGLGTGTTAGCFVDYPSIERIVVCEIEPGVVGLARAHFADENRRVLDDPRTVVVADDARHFLATTDETFDIITSDPIHPWVRGAAALYSTDYYELVQRHLAPGGVVTHWLPFYEANHDAAQSMLGTFFDAFPRGTLWHAGDLGWGNDAVMLARPDAPRFDAEAWTQRWRADGPRRLPDAALAAWADVEVERLHDLLRRFLGDAERLQDWLADAPRNADDALRLEYLAGMSRWSGASATDLHVPLINRRVWPGTIDAEPATRAAVEALWRAESDKADTPPPPPPALRRILEP
ncbi:MAG: fused MFS/spermidine synthase [Planctomycetota bacterium]